MTKYTGAINLTSAYKQNANLPIDDRFVFSTIADRNALDQLRRFDGMIAYVEENNQNYQLKGGIDNANWVLQGSSIQPYFGGNSNIKLGISKTGVITFNGGNFDEDVLIDMGPEVTINSITPITDTKLEVNYTTSDTPQAPFVISVTRGGKSSFGEDITCETALSTWFDLRAGGDSFTDGTGAGNDIRYRSGMSMSRDVKGISFSGSSPWSSWVKFENLGWTRGLGKKMSFVFTQPSSSMMIGIGSDATDETSSSQYSQMEVEAYFNSSTGFWGLYGNTGTVGDAGNQNNSATIGNHIYKIVFEDDGDAGNIFTLYQLPNALPNSWDDNSNIVKTFTIGGSLAPNELNIMPVIIPSNGGSQRFVAINVE